MNPRTIFFRYLPLAAVVAIQVLIIAIAPSKAPEELSGFGAPGTGGGPGVMDDVWDDADPFGEGVDLDDPTAPGGAARGPGRRAGGPGGGPGAGGTGTAGDDRPEGDTSHCVAGRQYDPNVYAYGPACRGKFAGNNGGNTYRGVSADEIKIVVYRDNLGEAVDALLTAQGGNPSDAAWQEFIAAAQEFINARYELYGRQINFIWWKGQCQSVPPNYPCLRSEMRQIVQQHDPFWVIRNTSLASPAFDELSRLRVMNSGGWGFRDSFRQQRRPFSWDLMMGGSQQVRQAAEWWCKRMHGGKAIHAGERNSNEDHRGRDRVLGVISTDDPENKLAVTEFKQHIEQMCGGSVTHEYYYAQDITTAEQQRRAAVETMRRNPIATTIICFCDLVAPIFLYQTCEEYQYYPEHVIAGTGLMDADAAAQAYDHTLQPRGYQFENAFGLAQSGYAEPRDANAATRVWQASGREGAPHQAMQFQWEHYAMVSFLLQNAGPNLNPQTVEQGAFRAGRLAPGNNQSEDFNQRSFSPGDYTWIDNMREVYWSTQQTSRFNGDPGRYISLNGGRWFNPGEHLSGQFQLPPKPR